MDRVDEERRFCPQINTGSRTQPALRGMRARSAWSCCYPGCWCCWCFGGVHGWSWSRHVHAMSASVSSPCAVGRRSAPLAWSRPHRTRPLRTVARKRDGILLPGPRGAGAWRSWRATSRLARLGNSAHSGRALEVGKDAPHDKTFSLSLVRSHGSHLGRYRGAVTRGEVQRQQGCHG